MSLLIDGVEDGTFIDKENAAMIFKQEFNEDVTSMKIGERSIYYSMKYGVDLTEEEYQASCIEE